MKNSENVQFYREKEILNNKVSDAKYYEFLYHLSKKVRLYEFCDKSAEQPSCTAVQGHDKESADINSSLKEKLSSFIKPYDTEVLKALKYKIITNQGIYSHIEKQLVLDTLFSYLKMSSSIHSFALSYSISKFNFDIDELLMCFYGPVFCREGLWINTLLILCFKLLERKVHVRIAAKCAGCSESNKTLNNRMLNRTLNTTLNTTLNRICDDRNENEEKYKKKIIMPEVVEDVLLKTIFFENKNKHAQRMRETALFLVYCMLRGSFNDEIDDDNCVDDGMLSVDHQCSVITLRFLKNVLLSVSLFDNQLECRRAASSILIDLQARKKIEFLPFIDFYSVKRKNNILNLPQEHYKGLLEQRMTRKIFDYDLEMQIICLEWMKRHRKGITLKKTIKKDEYNLCDLVERYDLREGLSKQEGRAACASKDCNTDAINEPISYTTALIAYLFLNQIEKIQIDFDEFLLEDKKFAFFADAYLKTTIFKNFDFKGECSFYDMVENVITPNNRRVSDHSSPFQTYYINHNTENSVNDQNLVFLLDNDSCPYLTMFLYNTLDSDFLFKRLVKRRSLSYFLINAFNTKYFAEYLELVKGMLNDRDVERTRIGMNCIYMMYRLYDGKNIRNGKDDDINVREETEKDDINIRKGKDDGKNILYRLLYHAIDTNLNNYTINYKGDVGYQCRKESFFLLFYLKDQRVNYYIIKYLFDKNKELREIVISFLREIGVFKNVKGYKTVYISGRRVYRGVEHLLSSAVQEDDNTRLGTLNNDTNSDVSLRSSAGRYESANMHGTLENVDAADCSLIDDSTASFLRSVDADYENVCSTMSGEKALFKGAFLNFSILEMKHRVGFTKAILSYFVNCDGSIYEILSWGINEYLIDYLVYVLKGTRREVYYVLRSIIILLDHSHQIDSNLQNDDLTNRIRNVQELRTCICGINDEKLNGMRDEIIQRMQWT